MNSIIKIAAKITEELKQRNDKSDAKHDGKQHTNARLGESLKKKRKKIMHGQYIRNIDRQVISEEDTFLWLSKGNLKAETESEIVAAQDKTLQTKYYATKILNTETESKCRLANNLTGQ
jgi:Ni,Fe-hydrogenase III component G